MMLSVALSTLITVKYIHEIDFQVIVLVRKALNFMLLAGVFAKTTT